MARASRRVISIPRDDAIRDVHNRLAGAILVDSAAIAMNAARITQAVVIGSVVRQCHRREIHRRADQEARVEDDHAAAETIGGIAREGAIRHVQHAAQYIDRAAINVRAIIGKGACRYVGGSLGDQRAAAGVQAGAVQLIARKRTACDC